MFVYVHNTNHRHKGGEHNLPTEVTVHLSFCKNYKNDIISKLISWTQVWEQKWKKTSMKPQRYCDSYPNDHLC